MIVLVLVAVFSWWVWHSGNKLQEAVNATAEAKVKAETLRSKT